MLAHRRGVTVCRSTVQKQAEIEKIGRKSGDKECILMSARIAGQRLTRAKNAIVRQRQRQKKSLRLLEQNASKCKKYKLLSIFSISDNAEVVKYEGKSRKNFPSL